VSVPRHLVEAAYGLLTVGAVDEAAAVLLEALDGPEVLPPRCSTCGARAWPGEEWRHVYSAHHPAESLRRAA
jgi:hypothetical protein